jgi:hypothetical protein
MRSNRTLVWGKGFNMKTKPSIEEISAKFDEAIGGISALRVGVPVGITDRAGKALLLIEPKKKGLIRVSLKFWDNNGFEDRWACCLLSDGKNIVDVLPTTQFHPSKFNLGLLHLNFSEAVKELAKGRLVRLRKDGDKRDAAARPRAHRRRSPQPAGATAGTLQ